MNNTYRLFLDDVRVPSDVIKYIKPDYLKDEYKKEWVICRNYQQFVDCIIKNGLPTHISFDHDLADIKKINNSTLIIATDFLTEKTGYDAAKWLCEYLHYNNKDVPIYYVHSINPVGKNNIINLLEHFKKYKK